MERSHFENKEYECAIALVGAAGRQLATGDESRHLFGERRIFVPPEFKNEREWVDWLKATRDWLKHKTPQGGDEWDIKQYDAAMMILRSITEFEWTYRQGTKRMYEFLERWREGEWRSPADSEER